MIFSFFPNHTQVKDTNKVYKFIYMVCIIHIQKYTKNRYIFTEILKYAKLFLLLFLLFIYYFYFDGGSNIVL